MSKNMNQQKENVLLSIISEDRLKIIVESAVEKVMLKLTKEDVLSDEFLDTKQICEMLKISKSTVCNWRNSGKLIARKIGHRILFKREDVKINELRPEHREVI